MKNEVRRLGQAGFTLIEILVALILISVLAAAVFPVVTQQSQQADAPRAANDLAGIRTAIELFNVNVKRQYPGDLEDLVHAISSADINIVGDAGNEFDSNDIARWDGPYLDVALAEFNGEATGNAFVTGFDGDIQTDLSLFNSKDANGGTVVNEGGSSGADFVVARIDNLTLEDFLKLNDLIDGETDSAGTNEGRDTGKLRCPGVTCIGVASGDLGEPVYYLAVPFRK